MSKIATLLGSLMNPKANDHVATIATRDALLTPDECAEIIRLADKGEQVTGTLSASGDYDAGTRRSNVTYLDADEESDWLYHKLGLAIQEVNDEAYNYDISGIESVQVATYGEGDHYEWHMDLGMEENATRKLSLTIQLTPPAEYEGGDLEFMQVQAPIPRNQGSVIFFPSFFFHRVLPVTRGTRKSLVAWVHGNSFR